MTWVEQNFWGFVAIGAAIFTTFGVVVLLVFRAVFSKLDRDQREMDEELKRQGVR